MGSVLSENTVLFTSASGGEFRYYCTVHRRKGKTLGKMGSIRDKSSTSKGPSLFSSLFFVHPHDDGKKFFTSIQRLRENGEGRYV
jgi:hypothetical protein